MPGSQRAFCSSVPWASSVGPAMPIPAVNTSGGVRTRASSCRKIVLCIEVPPRPPYSTGHVMQAHPASALRACQARDRSISSGSSNSEMADGASPGASGSASATSHARASARNAASSGVSSRSNAQPAACWARRSRTTGPSSVGSQRAFCRTDGPWCQPCSMPTVPPLAWKT